ncbi:hypothetical protein PTTG_03881 [Puccinia triticina 1-1 BBBD Race 1]|uniref:Acid phosphatase n=1 Tax=Puccinia triticina (isolate 1-1 / race 1 (BBBD)) TaxID=630390 RepID=A0A180GQT1_PUCT1|nr:hypothetical protein PTTG_03881 [Puccinia triticina 1-1 BBBD Race 1]
MRARQGNRSAMSSNRIVCLAAVASLIIQGQPSSQQPGAFPPSDQLGYLGNTQFGDQPDLINSPRQPTLQNHFPVLEPNRTAAHPSDEPDFIVSRHWGNLSPMFSLPTDTFGIQSGPEIPAGCQINQLHLVHRHGARYPTSGTLLPQFGQMIRAAQDNGTFQATGDLAFLNQWKFKLGSEVLTPFGRSQMFQLGVSYRQKYGFLLPSDPDKPHQQDKAQALPVFRTTSQHRMYHSALNFAAGFFGLPLEGKYHQSIIIENKGFNNSLAPYLSCPNSQLPERADAGTRAAQVWKEVSLKETQQRLNQLVSGIQFSISDINTMQALCAYESVALGTSEFCNLFTPGEWKDFTYANDLEFWYSASFGNPDSAALGAGWTEELLARLTQISPTAGTSSINVTLDADPVTFPLDQSIYVDATHDTVLTAIVVALNLTSLAQSGPLPTDRRLEPRSFTSTHISPFGAQLAAQVLTCPTAPGSSSTSKSIRFILNDAVVPLDGLQGCAPNNSTGLCDLDNFITGLESRLSEIDYQKTCFGP